MSLSSMSAFNSSCEHSIETLWNALLENLDLVDFQRNLEEERCLSILKSWNRAVEDEQHSEEVLTQIIQKENFYLITFCLSVIIQCR